MNYFVVVKIYFYNPYNTFQDDINIIIIVLIIYVSYGSKCGSK